MASEEMCAGTRERNSYCQKISDKIFAIGDAKWNVAPWNVPLQLLEYAKEMLGTMYEENKQTS